MRKGEKLKLVQVTLSEKKKKKKCSLLNVAVRNFPRPKLSTFRGAFFSPPHPSRCASNPVQAEIHPGKAIPPGGAPPSGLFPTNVAVHMFAAKCAWGEGHFPLCNDHERGEPALAVISPKEEGKKNEKQKKRL